MKWLATKALVLIIACVLAQIVIAFASTLDLVVVLIFGFFTILGAVVMWLEFKNSI